MEITLEIAKTMLNSGIEELVDTALKAFPELEETEESKIFSTLQRKIKKVNKGKNLHLKDSSVSKYYPVFHYDEDNVFSFNIVNCWHSTLHVPAPLLFVDKGGCELFVKANLDLYQQLYEGTCF